VYEDELQDDDDIEKYYCHFAVNSQRGLFYEFEWEGHREVALDDDGEGEGDAWDVLVSDDMEWRRLGKGKKVKTKGPTRPRKRIKKEESPESESEDVRESDSDSRGTEDEYEGQSDDDDEDGASDSESLIADEDDEDEVDTSSEPGTPSKKRKRPTISKSLFKSSPRIPSTTTTPRKPTKQRKTAVPTPHSRKSMATRKQKHKQKALRVRPPPPLTSHLLLENLPTDPWLRAMHVLHVGARPDVLPCREEEYVRCLRAVEELLEEGSGGCVCKFSKISPAPQFIRFFF
jgi:origin recognition complex subunit 1